MTKPSELLIHNVLFTTVSVFMFIFKFSVFIVVYIKSYYSLSRFLSLFYIKLDRSFNSTKFYSNFFVKQLRVVSKLFPISICFTNIRCYLHYTKFICYYFFDLFVVVIFLLDILLNLFP